MKLHRLALLWLLAGCSYTFDPSTPELPLLGTEPNTAKLPHLNTAPVVSYSLPVVNKVGYLVMQQSDDSYLILPLSGGGAPEVLPPGTADDVWVSGSALYLFKRLDKDDPKSPRQLRVRTLGQSAVQQFMLPGGPGTLYVGGNDSVFAYLVTDGSQPGYLLQQRNGSFSRVIPWPKGVDPANPFAKGSFFFNGGGSIFYDRDADGRVVGHSTRDGRDTDVGVRPRYYAWLDNSHWVTCGPDGLRLVFLDGVTPERVLDNDPCAQDRINFSQDWTYVYYDVGTVLRKVKLDGSEPPQVVYDFGQRRLRYFSTKLDRVIYSNDPSNRYINGDGDAWIDDWRFMERGRALSVTQDYTQLTWLENTAQQGGAGQLMTVHLPGPLEPGGTPQVLTRNTRTYSILADKRILADENHAFEGAQSRLVLIDPVAGTKHWVASSATGYSRITNPDKSTDLLVELIGGPAGVDLVRIPFLPPPPPSAASDPP